MEEKGLTIRGELAITPQEVVEKATTQAKLLMDIVDKTGCFQLIQKKKYLQVEAWETIGAFNRVNAQTENTKPILQENEIVGYEAMVGLYSGNVKVGGASMPCFFTENCCKGKEGNAKHKACMSAAQTFATSKAYRMNYSYIAILAGYQPTPAEEMTGDDTLGDVKKENEHWCPIHNTSFFKRGRMKSYAHPIEGTKDDEGKSRWCYEHKKTPEPGSTVVEDTDIPEQEATTPVANPDAKQDYPRDPATIKNTTALMKACHADFGLQPDDTMKELNIVKWADLVMTPKEAYIQIASSR